MPTRRTFLKASSLACAASALHPMLHAQNPATPDPFSNQNLEPGQQGLLTQAAFAAVLQSIFTLTLTDGSTRALRLVDVSDPLPGDPSGQNFTVSFTVAGGAFPQGTYVVDHATMGSFALFLVPSSTDSSAQSCTAVFNNANIQLAPLGGITQGGISLLPIIAPAPTAGSTLSAFRPAAAAASMSAGTAPVVSNNMSNSVQAAPGGVVLVESASTDSDSMDVLSDSTTSTDPSSCTSSTAKTTDSSSTASSSSSSSTASSSSNTSCSTTTTSTTTTSTTTQPQ